VALLASSQTEWELAQFDLASSGSGRMARRWAQGWVAFVRAARWRAARWGLAVVLLANLVGLNAWAWRLDAQVLLGRAQVRQVLTETFPKIRTVVDAPLQMEREVGLLRQSSGALSSRDLEPMLSALGAALPEGMRPTGLDFSAGQLFVKGLRLNPAQLELVSGKLSAQGYTAQQEGERLIVRTGAQP
jgi:general secretion pathway protein L